MKEEFIENLKEVFEFEDGQVINFDDKFRDYDEWDSLTHLSLIAMLDDEYEVQIESEEFDNLQTVQELFTIMSK